RAASTSVPFLAAQEPFGLGVRLVRSRSARKYLFEGAPADPDYQPLPEDRPGGFNWRDNENRGA
ncbi:hypothetical protein HPB47_009577, partial [Ixodes persulcatus]